MRFVLAMCLALVVLPARAEMVTFLTGVTTKGSDQNTAPKFDPSLGTLTSVLFDIRNGFGVERNANTSQYRNTTNETQTLVYSARYQISCCDSGIDGGADIPASSYEIFGGTQTAPGVFEIPPLAFFTISAFFSDRMVTDVPAGNPLDFYIATAMSDTFEIFGSGGENTFWENTAIAFSNEVDDPASFTNVVVKYEFTPVSEIPLPAAFWLMLSGLVALGPIVLRRRGMTQMQ